MGVLGITCGVMVWAGVALLGLHLIIEKMAWLHTIIMVGGGLYLCWMGYQMLRGALKKSDAPAPEPQVELARSGRADLKSVGQIADGQPGRILDMRRRHPGQAGQAAVADVLVDPLLDELRDPVDRRPDQRDVRRDHRYPSSGCMRHRIDRFPSKVQCSHHICLHNKWNRLS